jgi:hypothetical protein
MASAISIPQKEQFLDMLSTFFANPHEVTQVNFKMIKHAKCGPNVRIR